MFATQQVACSVPAVSLQEREASMQAARSEEPDMSSAASSSVVNGLFTRGQALRGERRFQQVCAACHRTNEITRSWFRGTVHETVGDLLDVISTTMPEGNPGVLSPMEYADILAFMLRLNDYPAGEEELPVDLYLLENVRISVP